MSTILEVTVGETTIDCHLRRSAKARRLRLVVTPGRVELVAPVAVEERLIREFVDTRRRWLYDKTRRLRDRVLDPLPARFIDGAEILLHGRPLRLRVVIVDRQRASLRHAEGLEAVLPSRLSAEQREQRTRKLVESWLRESARAAAHRLTASYAPRLGVRPTAIRIASQKTLWGSCSSRGVVSLNWRLMAAPESIFEYVVVHELCHLREHNHGPRFWRLVESQLPEFGERRAWLKSHGVGLR
jgi:predicted metal-dependent hydrolase